VEISAPKLKMTKINSMCKSLTINLLMPKKESNQSKIHQFFLYLPNFHNRITISDGISYNIVIVTDKAFQKVNPNDWEKSFEKLAIIQLHPSALGIQTIADKK